MSDNVHGENSSSATPPSPASKYGKDSEFGQILDFIQDIVSDEALRHEFDIPHLVVVGRQNMAKTTLINRLIGRYLLPMRKGKTATHLQALTTCPIILNLRHNDTLKVNVSVRGIPGVGGTVENPKDEDVEGYLCKVAQQLPKEAGTEISKTPVTVTLYGPGMSTLTLVDLPGVHFANDNDKMNNVTQDLVLDYIKKNKKSVILIVSQVGDPTGDGAINLVMKYAEDYKNRTICVLTKPDKHNAADDIGRKVATNQSHFTLETDHFILLRGKDGVDPKESQWDAETTRQMEQGWFSTHPQYKDLLHICGIDRLMDVMIKMLSKKMIEEIPHLIRSMKARKDELETSIASLNQTAVPQHDAGKGKLMSQLQSKLVDRLQTLLFNNTTGTSGGEKVRARFLTFNETILQINPLEDRTDVEIIKLLLKLEGAGAPLGRSSENNQLLEMLLYKPFDKAALSSSDQKSLPSPIDNLTSVCERLVRDVEKELKEIVLAAVASILNAFPDLQKSVEATVVPKIFAEKQAETVTFIKQFIQMQKKSVDIVGVNVLMPEDFDNDVRKLVEYQMNYQKSNVGKSSSMYSPPQQEPEIFTQIRHLSQRLHPNGIVEKARSCSLKGANYQQKKLIISTKKNVIRCFNHIKLNVIDTIPRCIQHFFITQLVESLDKELEQSHLLEFLQEKEDVRRKREKAQKTLDSINWAIPQTEKIAPMLLRIKQGKSAHGQ